jgi:hypothetical protein
LTTRVTLRYQNREAKREFRRGFEGERIIDWAEKTWGVSPEMTAITLNGVGWTPANFIPQDCINDFVPRFQNQVEETIPEEEEESKSEVTVFVDLLDQVRIWKLKTGFEWRSFSDRVNEIAGEHKWSASFGGQIWEDDSRTPEKNTTITIDMELPGGEPPRRLPSTHVQVRIDERDPFPLGLTRGKEWTNFRQCMDLILKKWVWTASLRGTPWIDDERKPNEGDTIQVNLWRQRTPVLQTVQVFVKIGSGSSQIAHLEIGNEWNRSVEWMTDRYPVDRWSATIDGHPWEDNSFAPTRDQTIRVNVTGEGGGKKSNKVKVWVKMGNAAKVQVPLIWDIKHCWEDFRSKITGELEHDAWRAKIKGPGKSDDLWLFDNSIKPDKNDVVEVYIMDEQITHQDEEMNAPIPERMQAHPKNKELDGCPAELKPLDEAMAGAPYPLNWVLTEAEKRMNRQILLTLQAIRKWANPKYAGLFLRNAIAAARYDDHRDRPASVAWDPIDPMSPVSALLVQLPLYKWPIPRDHSCFHPFCDHVVTDIQSCHLQRAHERKRIVPSENDKKTKRVWNGELALQATMADLLNVWSVAKLGAKYANPYAQGEEKKVATFKALGKCVC